jgi:DHA1 family bicyclomycin/chloramphenicol resistance-like MFS transporter
MLAHGVHQPCGQSGSVSPFPQAAGAASALSGFLMMVAAFGVGSWLGVQLAQDHTVMPLTQGLGLWSVLIATAAWTVVRRYGQLPRA